jgi:hypothetical protein
LAQSAAVAQQVFLEPAALELLLGKKEAMVDLEGVLLAHLLLTGVMEFFLLAPQAPLLQPLPLQE